MRILLISCIVFLFAFPLFSNPMGWENSVIITEKEVSQPSLIYNYNDLFAVYIKNKTNISFIRSTNEGNSWFDEKIISSNALSPNNPQILFADYQVYIFWADSRIGRNNIYFTHSEGPFGKKFNKKTRITMAEGDTAGFTVINTGDKIILAWPDNSTGDYELYVKSYDLLSGKWSGAVQITKLSHGSFYPCLISSLDDFYIFWQQKNGARSKIMYSVSSDLIKWSKPVSLSDGFDNAYSPSASLYSEGISVTFQGERDSQLDSYFAVINSAERSVSIPINVSRDLRIERFPQIINNSQGINLFQQKEYENISAIVYKQSLDNGLTWNGEINLTGTKADAKNYKVFYNSLKNSAYLIWEQGNEDKICFKKTDNFCPAPVIISSSHKENEWSVKKDANFKWKIEEDASGIKEFACLLDHESETIPEFYQKEFPVDNIKFYNLKDGVWYFHLNAKDNAGNISKTVHFQVMINSEYHAGKEEYYVVKYGDSLWNISKKFFNEPAYFKSIAEYNNIFDPELIYPHQIIKIPPKNEINK